jgi:hypothetical protein
MHTIKKGLKAQLIDYLEDQGGASVKELHDYFAVSRQIIHRHLKDLLSEEKIIKIGKSPRVFYQIAEKRPVIDTSEFNIEELRVLSESFIEITDDGRMLEGIEAFAWWCEKRNLPLRKTFLEYAKTLKKYMKYHNENGLIDGTQKLLSTSGLGPIHLKCLYYIDFYAIELFGKTKLGKLLHYAKQSQNKKLMKMIVNIIREPLDRLLKTLKIDAVGYIPPTISRDIQIMHVMQNGLSIKLPHLKIVKVKGEIVIPQKALSKIYERVNNAKKSIMVTERNKYNRVLLIDDAVGSGATINETAGKILKRKLASTVYAVAVTGSFKGFEVISEA